VVKLSPLCWLPAFRGDAAGSAARGEGVFAHEAHLCCDLLGSGTASPTVGAKQAVAEL